MKEIRVMRGVVYIMKSRGPRRELWEQHNRKYASCSKTKATTALNAQNQSCMLKLATSVF